MCSSSGESRLAANVVYRIFQACTHRVAKMAASASDQRISGRRPISGASRVNPARVRQHGSILPQHIAGQRTQAIQVQEQAAVAVAGNEYGHAGECEHRHQARRALAPGNATGIRGEGNEVHAAYSVTLIRAMPFLL